MKSFHGDIKIKEKYLARLKSHAEADEIIQGTGWENGKGCAVGCTLHAYDHSAYESELGIPKVLAHLEDRIFEGLSNEGSKEFPLTFLSAVPVGVDLKKVWPKFAIWMLTDPDHGVIQHVKNREVIETVAKLYRRVIDGEIVLKEEWRKARSAAYYAAAASASAAYAADAAAKQKHFKIMADKLCEILKESL